jgi:hypothetical protein
VPFQDELKGKCKDWSNSRFPEGMTERRLSAKAKTKTKAVPSLRSG